MHSLHDVTAAVLVGGLGTRLRSAVPDRPKVLAPVCGRPYVTYLLDQLATVGIREVVLLAGFGADQLRATLGDSHGDLRLAYSVEPQPLGTGGAVRWALEQFHTETILLLNGDSYCDVDLRAFADFHRSQSAAASLVLTHVEDAARFGRVKADEQQRIRRFAEKGTGGPGWINAGIYLLDRTLFTPLPRGAALSLERDLLPRWVHRGSVYGYAGASRFLDIGTPDSYAAAATFFEPLGCV